MPTKSKVQIQAFSDQVPGTSGLRRKVKVFQQKHYVESFIQSTMLALGNEAKGGVLYVGGDGRYYSKDAIQKIIRVAAANGVKKVLVALNGLACTPAVSCIVREYKEDNIKGAFILTASHNPGGPDNDFGIKYNRTKGEPAPEKFTSAVGRFSREMQEYQIADIPDVPLDKIANYDYKVDGVDFQVQVLDSIKLYVDLLESIFDFNAIRKLMEREGFSMIMDGMNGIAGPYAESILCGRLNMPVSSMVRCKPMEDFGGIHPDPNLVYNEYLVNLMNKPDSPVVGFACDGDADRNMVYGRTCFVAPSDSLAVITSYARKCIPWLKDNLTGVARSMPTSSAVDRVVQKLGLKLYETPTGWKYFGNLMEANKIQICGEESFGTGSSHIREKDGMWAILAWLSILAYASEQAGRLVTVAEIMDKFFAEYGRCYYIRYDYEGVTSAGARNVMESLLNASIENMDTKMGIQDISEFTYTDPVDGAYTAQQGIIYKFAGGSRIVWRLSGTGSEGATIRMYVEKVVSKGNGDDQLSELAKLGVTLSRTQEFTGMDKPTVIT